MERREFSADFVEMSDLSKEAGAWPAATTFPVSAEKSTDQGEVSSLLSSQEEVVTRRRGTEIPSKDYDSLDYDTCYNVPYKDAVRSYSKKTYLHIQIMRWVLVGVIGAVTGLVALFIDVCVRYLFKLKYSVFEKVYQATVDEGYVVTAFLVLMSFNVLFAIIAATFIIIEPVAAGSGIPEIKCYLNGIKVPHVTRLTTLVSKALGVLFSVAGGFFVGKEGPMIHSGAIVGAGIPQFRSMLFKWLKFPYPYFRSDRDKRDFVSSGAAAGVAAAFGAPIGGVLFSLEEGSSFWNQGLTWRTLFCSFCSTFTLNLFLSVIVGQKFATLGAPSLVDFGVFSQDERRLWNAYHLIVFIAMGAVGGLMGALFNSLNTQITIYRLKYLLRRRRIWRLLEAVLIIMCTTLAVSIAVMLLGTCVPVAAQERSNLDPHNQHLYVQGDNSFQNETSNYFCPHYGDTREVIYYNDLATILFNPQETAIKQLFHQNGAFNLSSLWVVFVIYFIFACWTYGAGIPSGLFIPCLVIGATYGRFVATIFEVVSDAYPAFSFLSNLYPGTYALIGAASFLGGVVRMTLSLTVILIESTNEIDYGLPIMLTLMVAKWVGDLFNNGLYDIHIEVKQTPLLGWESPDRMEKLAAEDVMNRDIKYLFPITRVSSIKQLLRTTAHSAFLVVTPVATETVPEKPPTIKGTEHMPQLYSRKSYRQRPLVNQPVIDTEFNTSQSDEVFLDDDMGAPPPDTTNATSSAATRKKDSERSVSFGAYPSIQVTEEEEVECASLVSSLAVSFSLPQHSRGLGIQEKYSKRQSSDRVLIFHGIILRSQLVTLLEHKIFFKEEDGPLSQPSIPHLLLNESYPRYPTIFDVYLNHSENGMLMDLSLYMNPSPYTIFPQAPLPQVFNLFRTMGLRHLPVIQDSGIVVGIITRHDLTHERLHELRHEKRHKDTRRRTEVWGGREQASYRVLSNSISSA